ncbi:ATP-dependent metallopeptidase FtsH/Yme1/Tma family protein [Campylobacter hyointestinalis]|uniref:ATP-dependent metallopeptidase FtsH/Yme1/Tma family protein n=2 Tax=Campylobacter hyointestinalis TaxID=198 RepID=UPI000723D969|nr:ATP-dependent metallopeptidase FtsH/Yme1/Tma family protein [Campylobacter hyointestinalis]PPB58996.1 AAA family ATPase [Campylobacter hyointestinalis subsp. hyointestinalis]PPB73604.1 AAA family ATPase [Campylobacter hyointestinalis subsp. hyointestinalis]PPB75815.1 AAA family ATPase [Campylobacter hyointestinalis subsp. hyointestinalis]PPB76694.1 AAA family ATPase [Campylobacter hyointestinalis subsp. hyointestinalis]PPB78043.1 AAA family ATPase [Campylobacter hyointestinalis subsp. hyoin
MSIMPKFELNKKNIIIVVGIILCLLLAFVAVRNSPKNINLMQYDNLLQSNSIQNAVVDGDEVILKVGSGSYYVLKDSINLNELGQKVAIKSSGDFNIFIWILFFTFLIFAFFGFKFIKKGLLKETKNSLPQDDLNSMVTSAITPSISNVMFKDVAGIDEVKVELMEIVDFLKNPKAYKDLGIKMPKGVLMVGPPGVGKTLVAKAVAGEANVPFFYQSGASFVQIYVGMGAKRVRELFAKAKAYAPSIIFIDEIDAAGKTRGGGRSDEREATLNQLLTEMDGFEDNSGVIVIAATNKIEVIDEALLRSGRFDRRIFLGLPDLKDRTAILESYLKNKKHQVDIANLAVSTTGFSGAGLATLTNEAAINAFRNKRDFLNEDDFNEVKNRVLFGKKKLHSLSKDEKEIQSLYKAARAVAAYKLGIKFERISLLEDHILQSDDFLESKTVLLSKIKVLLAGMAALRVYKNELYTNSNLDLVAAKELARKLIFDYGMNEKFSSNDAEVSSLLCTSYKDMLEFMGQTQAELFKVGGYLFNNESIDIQTMKNIIKEDQ